MGNLWQRILNAILNLNVPQKVTAPRPVPCRPKTKR